MRILSAGIIAATLFIFGCGSPAAPNVASTNTNASTTASPSDTTANTNTTATSSTGAEAEVRAAAQKFLDVKSFTAHIDNMTAKQSFADVKFLAPDRFYLNSPDSGEVMVIGRKSWTKKSNENKWTAQPESDTASQGSPRDFFKDDLLKTATDFKSEGEEQIDGQPTRVYSYKGAAPGGPEKKLIPFTIKLWVSKATGIPVKLHGEYQEGMLKWATVAYDTKKTVTIEEPK